MAHDCNDRWPWYEIAVIVRLSLLIDFICQACSDEFNFVSEFFCDQYKCFCIKSLVDGNHQTKVHASCNDFIYWSIVHQGRKVVYRNELSNLQCLILNSCLLDFLLGLLGCKLSLFLSVFGSEVVLGFAFIHLGISFLDLLLDFFLFGFSHGWAETVIVVVPVFLAILG